MPKCPNCGSAAHSYELLVVGDAIACPSCLDPRNMEGKMAEEKKQLMSMTLSEVQESVGGAPDHEVIIEGSYAGLEIKFNTTFDKIRTFFTQRREKSGKTTLQAVR